MTTVAWDGKTLAADSRAVTSYILQSTDKKIFRVRGHLVGVCGNASQAMGFVRWFKNRCRGPEPAMNECAALVISPHGVPHLYEEGGNPDKAGLPCAIGSGSEVAMGAMLAGAPAEQAVEIACRLDPNSGGPVQCLRLKK